MATSTRTAGPGATLPPVLAAQFRVVALLAPDTLIVVQTLLQAQGFRETTRLGSAIVAVFDMCAVIVDSPARRGLRAAVDVVTVAAAMRRSGRVNDEATAVAQALPRALEGCLSAEDMRAMHRIIELCVGKSPLPQRELVQTGGGAAAAVSDAAAAAAATLVASAAAQDDAVMAAACSAAGDVTPLQPFAAAVRAVGEAADHAMGAIVTGDCGSGKSCAIRCAAELLSSRHVGEVASPGSPRGPTRVVSHWLMPAALTSGEVYGAVNDAGEWRTGILPALIGSASDEPSSARCWVILDGQVDGASCDELCSIADPSHRLSLANSQRVTVPRTVAVIIEATSLEGASPSLCARFPLVHLGSGAVTSSARNFSWLRRTARACRLSDHATALLGTCLHSVLPDMSALVDSAESARFKRTSTEFADQALLRALEALIKECEPAAAAAAVCARVRRRRVSPRARPNCAAQVDGDARAGCG
jgi:hypothetical protein